MTETNYTYSVSNDFPNQSVSIDRLTKEIQDSNITTALSYITTEDDDCNIWFKDTLSLDSSSILITIVTSHSGEPLPNTATPVKIAEIEDGVEQPVSLSSELRDNSGKLRVHQTSRKYGLAIHWCGIGDDRSNAKNFGNGQLISFSHQIGDSTSLSLYVDFNGLLNETWIHELILTWKDCHLDRVIVDVVPDICQTTASSGTTFSKYGPIIIPAAGNGDTQIISDIYSYTGGLVAKDNPSDPTISPSPAFWDADFNESTGKFENLVANPYGTGEYNIFHEEKVLNRLFNNIQLLGSGFQIFNSSDVDQVTHGYRLRCTFVTTLPDHDWSVCGNIVMHRKNVGVNDDGTFA